MIQTPCPCFIPPILNKLLINFCPDRGQKNNINMSKKYILSSKKYKKSYIYIYMPIFPNLKQKATNNLI